MKKARQKLAKEDMKVIKEDSEEHGDTETRENEDQVEEHIKENNNDVAKYNTDEDSTTENKEIVTKDDDGFIGPKLPRMMTKDEVEAFKLFTNP